VLSALLLTLIRLLGLCVLFLRRVPFYVSFRWTVAAAGMGVRMLEGVTTALSRHALIYTGLTGDAFFPSARRARALTDATAAAKHRQKFKNERTS
jgi:Plasma-membrane choline transporter